VIRWITYVSQKGITYQTEHVGTTKLQKGDRVDSLQVSCDEQCGLQVTTNYGKFQSSRNEQGLQSLLNMSNGFRCIQIRRKLPLKHMNFWTWDPYKWEAFTLLLRVLDGLQNPNWTQTVCLILLYSLCLKYFSCQQLFRELCSKCANTHMTVFM
jgi:hypothetical protein